MPRNLEVYSGFNPEEMSKYFQDRGWPTSYLPVDQVKLVRVNRGAALECADGRFDRLEERTAHGVRIFGGINAIMALHTGGNETGFMRATELIKKFGVTPGTHSADHGGCGYADLWIAGKLKSAIWPYELGKEAEEGSPNVGQWLIQKMNLCGGRHFRLKGDHNEAAVRVNPFKGFTEYAVDGLRFRVDDWFPAVLGIPDSLRWFKIWETTEKLKPDAAILEVIVPNSWSK